MSRPRLSRENAVLLANDLLLREKIDLKDWDLRQMSRNIRLMKEILVNTKWGKGDARVRDRLAESFDELEQVISEKDATRVDAAHTHLEVALGELRERVFGI